MRLKVPEIGRPRELSAAAVKEHGIEFDAFWDIERVALTDDWATNTAVREGIEALLKRDRSNEEIQRIQLEMVRLLSWVDQALAVTEILHATNEISMKSGLILRTRHLYRAIASFSTRKVRSMVTDSDRATLLGKYIATLSLVRLITLRTLFIHQGR